MVSNFHLGNSFNNDIVNNHKISQLHTSVPTNTTNTTTSDTAETESISESGKISLSIHSNIDTPHYPTPQISLDHNIKNGQNNGSLLSSPPNSDPNFLGALKEWAIICKAIESGDQILLFRKGGIMEFRNGFELKYKNFFLFPTFEHQAKESIRSEYYAALDQMEKNSNFDMDKETTTASTTKTNNFSTSGEYTEITSFVEITHFAEVPTIDRLKALENFHIWTDDYLKTRFNYNPKKPLYLLLLRGYKLNKPIKIMNKPQWIGCKSWIQIESQDQDLKLYFENHLPENPFEYLKSISNPCIDDDNFNKLSEKVRSII
jgi:hypothetical protein